MSQLRKIFNPETKLIETANGIKIITPKDYAAKMHLKQSVNLDYIFNLPFNFYFLNKESTILHINETAATSCTFDSKKDAINRSMAHVTPKKCSRLVFHHDKKVIDREKTMVIKEYFERYDGLILGGVSVKIPWYADNHKVVGIFGFPLIGGGNFEYAAYLARQIGLNNIAKYITQSINKRYEIQGFILSQRQMQCIKHSIRGKSAKQIGKALNLSPRTVEMHLDIIKSKLGCQTKAELIEKIMDSSILEDLFKESS